MALATADTGGLPDVRMVLMKEYDARGFVFYTNFESQKGRELLANMQAAAVFHWKSLRRQVRIRGAVTIVSDAEADAYFARSEEHTSEIQPPIRTSYAAFRQTKKHKQKAVFLLNKRK